MDFFQEQERARGNSKLLVMLFFLAVGIIIAVVYLLAVILLFTPSQPASMPTSYWHPEVLFWVGGITTLIVASGSLYKISQLAKGGGPAIAIALGGTFVHRDTKDPLEQRLLNVVDEMAIASGVSVPRVFVLNNERGINAFAAGNQPSDAVVAVTRGSLEKLSRDELQGVIAHEFSHIFNGDMRLNLRLMGVLHGILVIAMIGRIMMRVRSRGRSSDARAQGALILMGLALFVIGYIGIFFGNMIKAAVSRQREYLADAAAVQYTRNPKGISGALQKIAGKNDATILNPGVEQASHMFFGQALNSLFATHPPIDKRIARIEPAFRALRLQPTTSTPGSQQLPGAAMGFAVSGTGLRESVGTLDQAHLEYAHNIIRQLPEEVSQVLHQPNQAAAIVYALLVAKLPEPEKILQECLANSSQIQLKQVASQHLPWIMQTSRAYWLPLVELALPAIRELPQSQQLEILHCCEALVKADGKVTLFEYALLATMEHQLVSKKRLTPARMPGLKAIQRDVNLLLSLMAHVGKNNEAEIRQAFAAATGIAPLKGEWKLLKPGALNLRVLTALLNRINSLNYAFKAKIIEACTAAIRANGTITLVESELLRAIAARIECPVPPLIADV